MKNSYYCDLNLVFYTDKENVVSAERIEGNLEHKLPILVEDSYT